MFALIWLGIKIWASAWIALIALRLAIFTFEVAVSSAKSVTRFLFSPFTAR